MAQIDFQLRLLVSKKTLLIIAGFQAFLAFGLIYATGILQPSYSLDMMREEYYASYLSEAILEIKFLSVLSGVLICAEAGSKEYLLYGWYILRKRRDMAFFWFSKLCAVMIMEFFFVTNSLLLFFVIGKFIMDVKMSIFAFFKGCYMIYILTLFHILLADFFVILTKHRLASVFSVLIFWFIETNISIFQNPPSGTIFEIFTMIIPIITIKGGVIANVSDIGGQLVFILLLGFLNCTIFYRSDL